MKRLVTFKYGREFKPIAPSAAPTPAPILLKSVPFADV
jgi:hypothetical protein